MRLTCDVDVVNRALSSHNLKKAARPCHSQLSIGKKPGNGPMKEDSLYLMLCTTKDKNGSKYLVRFFASIKLACLSIKKSSKKYPHGLLCFTAKIRKKCVSLVIYAMCLGPSLKICLFGIAYPGFHLVVQSVGIFFNIY